MSKKSIIWLEDNPNLSDYIPGLVDKQQFSLEICKTLKDFRDKCNFFLDGSNTSKLAGFIIDGVISSAGSLESLNISNVDTNDGTDVGMLVVRDYLLSIDKFSNLPILVLSILQNPRAAYQNIVKVNRFAAVSLPPNLNFIVKGGGPKGDPASQSIEDWLSKLPK